jgi:phosphate transport system permease protein
MIALMLAGNAVQIPHHGSDAVRTLTSHIGLLFAGDFDSPAFRSIFASGLILFGLTVVVLGIAQWLRRGDATY